MTDDEIDPWDDDELVRALRAPGSPRELSGEREFVSAFRAQNERGSWGRFAGRFGLGATTIVTTIALSGGVAAAAYTQTLPDPVQRFAHGVLGPIGVPAAPPEVPSVREPVRETLPVITPAPTAGSAKPAPSSPEASTPVSTPSPAATPVAGVPTPPDPAPTPTPQPRRTAASLTALASDGTVAFGRSVSVSGVLTATDGEPLPNRTVRLAGRSPGQPWARLAVGRTDTEGRITLQTPSLQQNTSLRLATPQGLRSTAVRVVVVPVLQATASADSGTTTIAVSTQGGRPGDTVVAYRRQGTELVEVGRVTLDADGSAVVTVPTPNKEVRIVLRLLATSQHARAQTALTIGS